MAEKGQGSMYGTGICYPKDHAEVSMTLTLAKKLNSSGCKLGKCKSPQGSSLYLLISELMLISQSYV